MDSINGPAVTPPTLPHLRPTNAEPEVRAGVDGAAPTPTSVPAEGPRVTHDGSGTETNLELPPPGVDPELWSVLNAEEREFFSVTRELGPVTYGRERAARDATSLPRGRRLDVRV